jgi:hypothetical protein
MTNQKPKVVHRQYNDQAKSVSSTETVQYPGEIRKQHRDNTMTKGKHGFRLVIVLSLFYLRLSFGHCIVSVLLTAFVW